MKVIFNLLLASIFALAIFPLKGYSLRQNRKK